MTETLIYDAVRTPRGKGRRGALHSVRPVAPAAELLRALAERNRLDTAAADDVVLGVVSPVGEQNADLARTAVPAAPFNSSTPTIQMRSPTAASGSDSDRTTRYVCTYGTYQRRV